MKLKLLALSLGLFALQVCALEFPTDTPFADRYPPASVKTTKRAEEVIAAYEHEKAMWNEWYAAEKKACYRNFFVTYCQDKAKETYTRHVQEARAVWLVARDFLRKERSAQAVQTRKENEAKQEARNAQIESSAKQKKVKTSGYVPTPTSKKPAEAKASGRALTREQEKANEAAYAQKQPQGSRALTPEQEKANEAAYAQKLQPQESRVLTKEQEKANEAAFEKKQVKHDQRVEEEKAKEPTPPSMNEAERVKARAERRAEAEKKRLANIKKREAKAAEYERQMRLREEKNAQGLLNQFEP